jgi:hypothetical protein
MGGVSVTNLARDTKYSQVSELPEQLNEQSCELRGTPGQVELLGRPSPGELVLCCD